MSANRLRVDCEYCGSLVAFSSMHIVAQGAARRDFPPTLLRELQGPGRFDEQWAMLLGVFLGTWLTGLLSDSNNVPMTTLLRCSSN